MHKGSIVLIPFPFTDLSGQKIRPAVVLSDLGKSEDCMVVFISSIKERTKINISIKASLENGLKTDSVIKVSKIATLEKKSILGEIGVLEKTYQNTLDIRLKEILSL